MWDYYSYQVHLVNQIKQVSIGSSNSNDTHTLDVNDVIAVSMTACPTCGYQWLLDISHDSVQIVKDHSVPQNLGYKKAGGHSNQTIFLQPTEAGEFTVKMAHIPFWETLEEQPAEDLHQINLSVN